jgi:hypothetical protein
MDNKGNNIISKDDFLRYRTGRMTNEERNAFEKELQKDPFAEEAAEGLSLLSADEAEKDLNEISKRITKRTIIKSPAIYYRIAAAIAVLVTISVIFVSRNRETEVMLSKSDLEKPDTILVIAASEPLMDKTEKSEVRNEPGKRRLSSSAQQSEYQKLTPIDIQQVAITSDIKKVVTEEVKDDNYPHPAEAEKKMEMSKVAGVSSPMAAKSMSGPGYSGPQPLSGIDSFNIYLEKNIRLPHPGSSKEKIVILSFIVRTDSTLADMKILESPGQQYSREAKRLIKEGPLWKPAMIGVKPLEEEYRVTIRFR